jgi:hypothetical protein
VAVTFWYTWLFVHTGGSVFITILAHAAEGLIGRKLIGDEGWSGSDETHWVWLYTAAWCALAIVLLVFDWQFWRSRTPSTSRAVHSRPVVSDPERARSEQAESRRALRDGHRNTIRDGVSHARH